VGLTNLGSESETCVGSRVRPVGVSISFEKNFYRLPFTPPSLVRRFGPSIAKIFIYHIVMGGREEYEWIHKVSFAIHTMLAMVVRCMILLLRRVTFDYVCLMLYLDFLRYTIRPVRSVEKDTYVIEKDLYVRIRRL
jgi:hypothetical protein